MPRKYNHYCPVAFTLEIINSKWSFPIIRDLLSRPQRFSDLLRYSSNITPRWLSLTLRNLEEARIIQREKCPGQREVWYKLTPAGEDLRPVLEAMKEWGLQHAMRPPFPGEVVHPDLAMGTLASSMNMRSRTLSQPSKWQICFSPGDPYVLSFDGEQWSASKGEETGPHVTLTVSPREWATFLAVKRNERKRLVPSLQLNGTPERVEEFLRTFGVGE